MIITAGRWKSNSPGQSRGRDSRHAQAIYTSVVWDFQANTFAHPPTLQRADNSVVDYFCCGHCALPDGRLLVGGGSDKYDKIIVNGQMQDAPNGFTGLKDAMLFDPVTETWKLVQRMEHARWGTVALSDRMIIRQENLLSAHAP